MRYSNHMLHDLRFAWRSLWKAPAFTLTVILTLGLGIGVNSVIFSVVDAALLRPLPYPSSERLYMLWEKRQVDPNRFSDPKSIRDTKWHLGDRELPRYRSGNHSFTALAGYEPWQVVLTGSGEPERLTALMATPELFPMLGLRPAMGRFFRAEEDQFGANGFALLSHGFWQRRFGGDPRVLGTRIVIDGEPHEIVGILPPDTRIVLPHVEKPVDLWLPSSHQMALQLVANHRKFAFYLTIGSLKPGVTVPQAQADLEAIGRQMEQERKRNFSGMRIVPVVEELAGEIRPALLILLAAAGCVLLVGCANIANLVLARSGARQAETAVRAALGATRQRLIRDSMAETLLVGALGGAAGLVAARLASSVLLLWIPAGTIPRLEEVSLDWRLLAFAFVASMLCPLLFGLPAALLTPADRLSETLKLASPGAGGSLRGRYWRRGMVVAEIGLAVVLVTGAGLLARSFLRLRGVDLGFRTERVTAIAVALPDQRYHTAPDRTAFAERVVESLRRADGVEAAAATNFIPVARDMLTSTTIGIEGRRDNPGVNYRVVMPDYFRVMGIALKRGRTLTDRDTDAAVVINEAMARRFWPAEKEVLGRRVEVQDKWAEIVGVVADIKHDSPDRETEAELYVPFSRNIFPGLDFVVRTRAAAVDAGPLLRAAVKSVDASFPLGEVRTMEQLVSDSVATPRFYMRLMALFAGLAAALAAVGIYGLIAYSVVQRSHEIGVRLAIGASRGAIFRMMLREGFSLGVAGAVVGLAASFAATRLLGKLLFGVKPVDPPTFAAVALGFVAVAVAASCIPAARTGRIDPVTTLRQQ